MENVKNAIVAFLKSPVGAFTIDLVDYAVLGAAIAAVGLPDDVGAKEAIGLIVGGAIGSVKGFARIALKAYIASRKPA